MPHLRAHLGQRQGVWRIIPLTAFFCLALSGTGARLAESPIITPESESYEEALSGDTVASRGALQRMRMRRGGETLVEPRSLSRRVLLNGDRRTTSGPISADWQCLIAAGVKLLC